MQFQRDIKVVNQHFILIMKEDIMKYTFLAAILLALSGSFLLSGCGEPKPYNQPPSLYEDPESGERLGAPSGQ